eukprot:6046506-Ditylum_brightwellii.AAC.1
MAAAAFGLMADKSALNCCLLVIVTGGVGNCDPTTAAAAACEGGCVIAPGDMTVASALAIEGSVGTYNGCSKLEMGKSLQYLLVLLLL